jgi:hypothetical protein
MWILHFLPDSLIQLVVIATMCTGAGLYILGLFINFVPPALPYREPIRIVGSALLIAGIYFYGGYSAEMQWRGRVAELQAKVAVAEAQSKEANDAITTKVVEKIKVVHDIKVITKEVIHSIASQIDAECRITPEVITILNASAHNVVPTIDLTIPKEEVK